MTGSMDQQNDQKNLVGPTYFEVVEEASQNQEEDKQGEISFYKRKNRNSRSVKTDRQIYSSDEEEGDAEMFHAVETLNMEPAG